MIWFEAIVVTFTLLTGSILLLDRLVFAKRRAAESELLGARDPIIVDYARSFFPILLAILILRSFIIEPFRIPSSSMMPTLLTGDFILVNKFSYGIRLPITNTKMIPIGQPERGDVVVFRPPHRPDEDWIKRVIGLPGDTVAYRDNTVYINGTPLNYTRLETYVGQGQGREMNGATLLEEHIPGHSHQILEIEAWGNRDPGQGEWTVPQGHYLVMGDNRDRSDDGRFWGVLPESQLRGKAFLIWMNLDTSAPGWIDWSRIGSRIQ